MRLVATLFILMAASVATADTRSTLAKEVEPRENRGLVLRFATGPALYKLWGAGNGPNLDVSTPAQTVDVGIGYRWDAWSVGWDLSGAVGLSADGSILRTGLSVGWQSDDLYTVTGSLRLSAGSLDEPKDGTLLGPGGKLGIGKLWAVHEQWGTGIEVYATYDRGAGIFNGTVNALSGGVSWVWSVL